jgi:spore germination protein YaaH
VYFDAARGLVELRRHGSLFDRVSLFAYELDPEGIPQPAPDMEQMIAPFLGLAAEKGFSPWVTVVNDTRHSVDSATAKDPDLIHGLIADAERRATHAKELAERVAADGFKGLHLDYERLPETDAQYFQEFVRALHQELELRGLGLETVVEPERGPLPEARSTSVTVMAYDLFGAHSGPGPRSTPAYVSLLGSRAAVDADSAATLALAVRGFAWKPGGEVSSLDWAVAQQLADRTPHMSRGMLDRVPSARLADGTELWFEDPESLLSKWQAAWGSGFRRLAIWRLGGNDERLFNLLSDVRRGSARR